MGFRSHCTSIARIMALFLFPFGTPHLGSPGCVAPFILGLFLRGVSHNPQITIHSPFGGLGQEASHTQSSRRSFCIDLPCLLHPGSYVTPPAPSRPPTRALFAPLCSLFSPPYIFLVFESPPCPFPIVSENLNEVLVLPTAILSCTRSDCMQGVRPSFPSTQEAPGPPLSAGLALQPPHPTLLSLSAANRGVRFQAPPPFCTPFFALAQLPLPPHII